MYKKKWVQVVNLIFKMMPPSNLNTMYNKVVELDEFYLYT